MSAESERSAISPDRTVSIIIPARNESRTIARLIQALQEPAPVGWVERQAPVDE